MRRSRRSAQQKLGLPKAYKSIDEVLADPAVQVVHLAVPNVLHYQLAKKALQAGKHVLVEKPLAMNSKESGRAGGAGEGQEAGRGRLLQRPLLPAQPGGPRHGADAATSAPSTPSTAATPRTGCIYDTDYNWRVLADQGGELRAISDIGTHWMDLVDVDHRPGSGGGVRRPADGPSGPQAAQGRGADLHRQGGAPRRRPSR